MKLTNATKVTLTINNNISSEFNVLSVEGENRNFFNATELWRLAGADQVNRPDQYLRSEKAQEYITWRYENLNENNNFQKLSGSAFNFDDRKALPSEITSQFIYTTRGRYGATWMDDHVFLDYAQWLSPEIKDNILNCFRSFGFIYNAPANKQAELLIEEARKVETKVVLDNAGVVFEYEDLDRKLQAKVLSHVSARLQQMEVTGKLKELVKLVWGADGDREMASTYELIFGTINTTLFGATKAMLAENLGIAKSTYTRDSLTSASLNCLISIESEIALYLEDCIEEEVIPSMTELKHFVMTTSKRVHDTMLFRGGRKSRIIAERERLGGKKDTRGTYQVELNDRKQINSIYTPY